jgi:hypothetical protein
MNEVALQLVETDEVAARSLSIVDQANAVMVVDADTYTKAGFIWKSIQAMKAEVDAAFDKNIKRWHEGHKDALADKAKYYSPLDAAARKVKQLMSDWQAAQEAIRKAEEDRLRKIAEEEEKERQLAAAVNAEQSGDTEMAEAIIEAPVYVAPIVVPKAVPKMAGGPVYREVWAAEVTDIKALCMAVATGKASTECVTGNMVALNRMAVALKGTLNIPGVRAYSKRV